MKQLLIAGIIAAATTTAAAQPFAYQLQIGSTEYVPGADTGHLTFTTVTRDHRSSSLAALMLGSNVDGVAANDFSGEVVKSGPIRISLYEVQRGSPEASANRGYYDRFPADTDWAAVAREYHEAHSSDGLAAHGGAQYGTS
ncbi:MAG: hypothetical protein KDI67_02195 [Gammaproteobacteria bacterium]|nr:hypothetical protein [Gammaproteobacteria bacterium]